MYKKRRVLLCCERLLIVDEIASKDPVYTRHLHARMRLPGVVLSGGAGDVVSAKAVGYCMQISSTHTGSDIVFGHL